MINLWSEGSPRTGITVASCVEPVRRRKGEVLVPVLREVADRLWRLPGHLSLGRFEQPLAEEWPKAFASDNERASDVTTALDVVSNLATDQVHADIAIFDVGPSLGALNRAVLLACDSVIIPVAPDLFSLQGLRNVGPTLIELLVVVAIIAILAGMLFPALARARDRGRAAVCQSNLRQLILAATMYEQDHNSFPIGWDNNAGSQNPPGLWYYQLQPFLGKAANKAGGGVFICPSSLQKAAIGQAVRAGGVWGFLAYAQNGFINNGTTGMGSKNVKDATGTLLYADTDGWDSCLYPDRDPKDNPSDGNVCYRHSGGGEKSSETVRAEVREGLGPKNKIIGRANVAFIDSHVELRKKVPKNLFTLEID